MGVEKDVQTVYGTVHGQGLVICAYCGATKGITIADFPSGKPLAVACGCGQRFSIRIEVRQFVRRSLHLPGEYERHCDERPQGSGPEPMIVENVSQQGLCFRTTHPHAVRLHETLSVHFTLDDAQRTPVSQRAVVKYVDDDVVGVQFLDCDPSNATNRALAMYMRSP
jgi:PilZ domain